MIGLLALLLALTIAGLAFLGFLTFQLQGKAANLNSELVAQRTRCDSEINQLKDLSVTLKARYKGVVDKYNEDAKKWHGYTTKLKSENQRLSKWSNVADAEVKAAEMLSSADAVLKNAKTDATQIVATAQIRAEALQAEVDQHAAGELASAKEAASTIASESKEKAKALKGEAEAILNSATSQSARILEAANKKAEEIAGSAFEAMKNASFYEQAVKSMKNIIDGYGDQYIIPPHSLLDDLADDFGHTHAGQELKRARERTKIMIRNGTAAACQYVEANRRETAINFVVDAFNGKVDSILSRAKHDNAGKLAQEIRDAFNLVNLNGKAFRDARITDEFLTARLDELTWAATSQQLALQDREEQRHAKEQAREEARADKERERAIREAGKEEEMLRKAMEQAQEQFEHASGEQKTMYEARLQEMTERLGQALERKERARSMAEQTKKGHVYIISNIGSFGDTVYKIGLTRRMDPRDRVDELGGASVPFGFDVHATILSDDAPALEQKLHNHFVLRRMNKVNHRKEFFQVSLKEIREEIESIGLTGFKWTMTAEAKEYRETGAIERLINDNPAERERWIKRQLRLEVTEHDDLELVGAGAEDD